MRAVSDFLYRAPGLLGSNVFPQTAKEYEPLKLGIWRAYEHNGDGNIQGKSSSCEEIHGYAKVYFGEFGSTIKEKELSCKMLIQR